MRGVVRCGLGVALLLPVAVGAQERTSRVYHVDPAQSHIFAVTHRAGLFSFLGHEHAILASEFTAALCLAPDVPPRSALRLTVPTRSLVIDSDSARRLAGLGGGPGADTRAEIARKLLDERRLHADAHPTLSFESSAVDRSGPDSVKVQGRLTIRGVERAVTFPALLTTAPTNEVRLRAKLRIKLSDFGITPETVAGVVKVSNDVDLYVQLLTSPTADECNAERNVPPG